MVPHNNIMMIIRREDLEFREMRYPSDPSSVHFFFVNPPHGNLCLEQSQLNSSQRVIVYKFI